MVPLQVGAADAGALSTSATAAAQRRSTGLSRCVIDEIDTMGRTADGNQLDDLSARNVDHRNFFDPAQRDPQGLAVVSQFHAVRAAGHVDGADVFELFLVDDVDGIGYPV